MADQQEFSDDELLRLYKNPASDLSKLTSGELKRLDTLTATQAKAPATATPTTLTPEQINPSWIGRTLQGAADRLGKITDNPGAAAASSVGGATAISDAIPMVNSVIPSAARAGQGLQDVAAAAKGVAVDVNAPGSIALRIQELADRGATMPTVVRKFLTRVTDPSKPPVLYEEARDFASNISKLSADEYGRLSPTVAREVSNLRVSLNQSIASAAAKVGKGEEYAKAMKEYIRAKKASDVIDAAITGAKWAVPFASAGGVGYWLASKLKGLVP